ncbi:hypothetical protein [Pseudonocardia sp. H11422]|uniref:hypothetical protein n=1 Tax=Pseudonocardia sp. H11422 TaxID=2835866 RepID=UPI001BDCFE9F|nr:hypothetical protein [Pseudonocardia sp. H11422]
MVIRPVLRWLLHSRRRFYGVTIGLLLTTVVVARVLATSGSPEPVVAAAPAATSSAPAPTTEQAPVPPPVPDSTTETPPPTPSPRVVAVQFAELWADPTVPAAEWLARLQPLATEEYGAVVLAQVDPANIPATAVTGSARVLEESEGAATVSVPLDVFTLRIDLVDVSGAGAWRVSDVQRMTSA